MSGQSTPVNANDVVTLDMKNLSGSVQFRVTVGGDLQWKLLNGSTWFKICNIELLRGRSITDVTVNAQNKFVLTFSDLTTQVITISALEDAVLRATNAATQALASAGAASAVAMGQATARPTRRSSIFWDFSNSKVLDPRLTLQRNSVGSYFDRNGNLQFARTNVARFTHDPLTGESLGLIYEGSRKNIILYSENFNTNPWSSDSVTLSNGSLFWGKYQSTRISEIANFTGDPRLMYSNITTLENGKRYTFSMYVRYIQGVEDRYLQTNFNVGFVQSPGAIFDLKNNSVVATNGLDNVKIRKLKNGIFRVSYSTLEANGSTASFRVRPTIYNNNVNIGAPVAYTTSGTASSFEIFGAQLEEGISDSSYMPTNGATFTRASDRLGVAGTMFQELFPTADFKDGCTMFLSARRSKKRVDSYYPYFRFLSGTGNYFSVSDTPSGTVYAECWKDGVQKLNVPNVVLGEDEFFKMSFALKQDDSAVFVNGTKLGSDSDVEMPVGVTSFWIGDGISTIIKQFGFWPERLTDVEALAITSNTLSGKDNTQVPANSDLGSAAYTGVKEILRSNSRQEFSIDCTGSSITRNIRRPYPFLFEIVDSSGVTVTAQPSSSCVENTDNNLVITGAVGKTLTYSITPIFEY
ncbi:phage head spike fiber domain-containing protein [Flectobacillus roseus]